MKKIFLFLLLIITTPIVNADGPFSNLVLPAVTPGGDVLANLQAQQELRRQYLENQMMQEQLAEMRQERNAAMEPENISQNQISYSRKEKLKYISYIKKIIYCLENNHVGQSVYWRDSKEKISYSVTPIQNVTYRGNRYCRQYRLVIKGPLGQQQQNNLACRQPNGAWLPVN